jgi:hypothetical protein
VTKEGTKFNSQCSEGRIFITPDQQRKVFFNFNPGGYVELQGSTLKRPGVVSKVFISSPARGGTGEPAAGTQLYLRPNL